MSSFFLGQLGSRMKESDITRFLVSKGFREGDFEIIMFTQLERALSAKLTIFYEISFDELVKKLGTEHPEIIPGQISKVNPWSGSGRRNPIPKRERSQDDQDRHAPPMEGNVAVFSSFFIGGLTHRIKVKHIVDFLVSHGFRAKDFTVQIHRPAHRRPEQKIGARLTFYFDLSLDALIKRLGTQMPFIESDFRANVQEWKAGVTRKDDRDTSEVHERSVRRENRDDSEQRGRSRTRKERRTESCPSIATQSIEAEHSQMKLPHLLKSQGLPVAAQPQQPSVADRYMPLIKSLAEVIQKQGSVIQSQTETLLSRTK